MRVEQLPEAEKEIEHAVDYYEERSYGLGDDFLEEYHEMVGKIIAHPKRFSIARGKTRWASLKRFPYKIIYWQDEHSETLYIIAVAHWKKRPFYWDTRMT